MASFRLIGTIFDRVICGINSFWCAHLLLNLLFVTGTQANFDKASAATTNPFGVEYDYGSVMHYSANAFSKNGQPTIAAKVIHLAKKKNTFAKSRKHFACGTKIESRKHRLSFIDFIRCFAIGSWTNRSSLFQPLRDHSA